MRAEERVKPESDKPQTFEEALHDMIEADGACPHNLGEHPARVRAAHAAEVDEARKVNEVERCHHGWRGQRPKDGQRIVTPCPACGLHSLFIADGGHLTCASVGKNHFQGCPDPSVEEAIKHKVEQARAAGVQEGRRQMAREALQAIKAYGSDVGTLVRRRLESQARDNPVDSGGE